MGSNSSKQIDVKNINIERIESDREINISQISTNSIKQKASADGVGLKRLYFVIRK